MKGEIPTGVEGWLHGGAILVTMCFKSRFECPCMNHSKVLEGWSEDYLGNKLEFKEKKTGRYHYFGMDEGDDVPCHV